MIAAERTVLVLLAAGRSSRFGAANKLEQDYLGKPVGLHAAAALEDIAFLARVAVVDQCDVDFAKERFTVLRNDDAASGMAGSLRIGVAHAKALGADAVVVALADMPCITAAHIRRLLAAADAGDTVISSSDGSHAMPPAVFGRARFDALCSLTGDKGARDLIRAGRHMVTDPAELIDIDTPDDLERLRASTRSGE